MGGTTGAIRLWCGRLGTLLRYLTLRYVNQTHPISNDHEIGVGKSAFFGYSLVSKLVGATISAACTTHDRRRHWARVGELLCRMDRVSLISQGSVYVYVLSLG